MSTRVLILGRAYHYFVRIKALFILTFMRFYQYRSQARRMENDIIMGAYTRAALCPSVAVSHLVSIYVYASNIEFVRCSNYIFAMPFKRPSSNLARPESQSETPSSRSPSRPPPAKQRRTSSTAAKALPDTKVFIVQAKMDMRTLASLVGLADRETGGVCKNAKDADVIVTAVSMRRRLERHVPWDIAVRVNI